MDGQPKRLAAVQWLIDHHRDALEYELILLGLRLRWLGGPLLSWHDVWLIAANAPTGSRLASLLDQRNAWTPTDWWLRSIEYSLRWLVWSKTKDGQKNRGKPKPTPAPGDITPKRRDPELTGMGKRELRAYLRRPRVAFT